MGESVEFESTEWITAGAVGEPGARTFFIQARAEGRVVALLVEKGQVAGIAELAQELLGRFDVTVTPDDLDEAHHRLIDGIEPLWRVGELSLGASSDGERFVLEAMEILFIDPDEAPDDVLAEEPGQARFWLTRHQLVRLAAYAAYAVEAGARERCRLCGRPIDPVEGHVCPATNGHGKLTR
ncbi:MAG TPA: DUF3090 family protein [Egibacteraceae bacterium]|nr:DUF3090 family protein [Egibacteraceae bacterium]